MAGRRPKLNKATVAALAEAIEHGATYERACQAAGVGYSTFCAWKKEAEEGKGGVFQELLEAINDAEGRNTLARLREIIDAAKGGREWVETRVEQKLDKYGQIRTLISSITHVEPPRWQAAAWLLERRYPQDYGRQVTELQGKGGGPIEVDEVTLSDADRAKRIAQIVERAKQRAAMADAAD